MKVWKSQIAILLACASWGLAQSPEQRGKRVIDDAVAALGGEKFLKMEDRIESGRAYSFYRDELTGLSIAKIYTRYVTVAPNESGHELGVRERQAFGKNEDSGAVLLTEKSGWEVTFHGAKEFEQDRFERYRDTTLRNVLYLLRQRLHEPGLIFEWRSSAVVENQPVDVVDITDSQNRVITVSFHQSTKLPVRETYAWRDAKTRERNEEVTRFSRYRDVGGVQWPLEISRERNGEKVYQIFSESVEINRDLTDNLFSLPAAGETSKKAPVKKK